ncbi:FKBP-type peptidyl-prolyl cis-trans isomerase [Croceitalea dokdonensis]|nr:FKBP-type peptidyl-prolyl cis-trans isomerase [Croceitalea dokdonensis]
MIKKMLAPLLLLVMFGCSSDSSTNDPIDFTEANEQEIQAFIAAQELNAQRSSTGLYYVINDPGFGDRPTSGSNVTVAYRGYFTNGDVFDESGPEGISFNLNQVIPGWTEGITYFGEGGSGMLLVPSRLGYGNTGRGSIPGGAVLVFDVNVLSIN